MRRFALVVLLAAVLLGTSLASASDQGLAAAEMVSHDSYYDFMDSWLYTHTGHNRGPSGMHHDLARNNILAFFQSWGLDAALEPFTWYGGTGNNVVATKLGTLYPDQIYIIGAHYDSVNNPGADDNASGVALVLEAARILSQFPSDYTIRFIAFDMEEQGLRGSQAYVAAHSGDNILGMISADMVAYDPGTNHALIYGRSASSLIKTSLGQALTAYGDGLTYTIEGTLDASNHAPFEGAGYQACLLIEGEVWSNPHYHTQQDCFDTPGYLNFDYAIKMTRSVVGWLVDQAGVQVIALLLDVPGGVPWRVEPGVPLTITVRIRNAGEAYVPISGRVHYRYDGGDWLEGTLTSLGDNLYEASLPTPACGDAPEFYFSATGDGGSTVYLPEAGAAGPYAPVVAQLTEYLVDDFESDLGWTVVSDSSLTGGEWERGVPVDCDRGDPPACYGGTGKCFLTENNPYNCNSDVDWGPTRLVSPVIDLGGATNPTLSYARWFTCDDAGLPDEDFLDVEVSTDDGVSWTLIETVAHGVGWVWREINLAEFVTPTAQTRIRFTVDDTPNNSITEAGIDAFRIHELSCSMFGLGDMNCDGVVNGFDIDPFVLALIDRAAYAAQYPDCDYLNGDANGDGLVNAFDIDPFVALLTGM
jgi:hypothetical protein